MGDFNPLPLILQLLRLLLTLSMALLPVPFAELLEPFNPVGEYFEFDCTGEIGDSWPPLLLFNVVDGVEVVDSGVDCGETLSGGVD